MPTINLRELRDTRTLKAWLSAGQTVELRERDRVLASIVPIDRKRQRPLPWPDFSARAKRVLGSRIVPGADLIIEERGRF